MTGGGLRCLESDRSCATYQREQRTGGAFVNTVVAYGGEEMTYEAGGWDLR